MNQNLNIKFKGSINESDVGVSILPIAILKADNSGQYQLGSQTGACSAHHSLRPHTTILTSNETLWDRTWGSLHTIQALLPLGPDGWSQSD